MRQKRTGVFLTSALAPLLASLALAGAAGATPAWHFGGVELEGAEGVLGSAANSRVTVPGLTTDCDGALTMTIFNKAKVGAGEVTELPLANCTTDSSACTIETAEAVGLPWFSAVKTASTTPYLILKEVEIEVLYGGEECVLSETVVPYEGTAGGRFDNINATVTFDPASFAVTGTGMSAFGIPVEWSAVFPMLATGMRKGKPLTIQ